jgi:hypothetical protein
MLGLVGSFKKTRHIHIIYCTVQKLTDRTRREGSRVCMLLRNSETKPSIVYSPRQKRPSTGCRHTFCIWDVVDWET